MRTLLILMTLLGIAGAAEPAGDADPGPLPALSQLAGVDGWFRIAHPETWSVSPGAGFIELTGPAGAHLRIYAIGLREAGGKYRNLEHCVDDTIFQMRDEFGGEVGPKFDVAFTGAGGHAFQGRGVTGHFTRDGVSVHSRIRVVAHTAPGVVLSIQHRAADEAGLDASQALIDAMLATLAVPPAPQPATP